MDNKIVFEVAKQNGELYEKLDEIMERTENEELKNVLAEVTDILSDNRSKLLSLGKYMNHESKIEKEAINIVAYGNLPAHTKLNVLYEYDNDYALVFDSLWTEHYLPKKLLKYL